MRAAENAWNKHIFITGAPDGLRSGSTSATQLRGRIPSACKSVQTLRYLASIGLIEVRAHGCRYAVPAANSTISASTSPLMTLCAVRSP